MSSSKLSRTILTLSAIALVIPITGARAQDDAAPSTQSGTVPGGASMGGNIYDEPNEMDSEMEFEPESELESETEDETTRPRGMDTKSDTRLSEPEIDTDTSESELEMEGKDTYHDDLTPAPSSRSPSLDESPELEEEDVTSTSQSGSTALGTATPGHETQATFPDVKPVESREQYRPTLGLLAGYQDVRGTVNGAPGFGLDAGFNILVPISVGVQIQYSPSDIDVGNLKSNFDTTNYLARAYYNFGGDVSVVKHTYMGWKAGLTRYSGATDADSDTAFSLGPVLGMDFPVDRAKKFTVGPEAAYLSVLDNDDQFTLSAAARYWF